MGFDPCVKNSTNWTRAAQEIFKLLFIHHLIFGL